MKKTFIIIFLVSFGNLVYAKEEVYHADQLYIMLNAEVSELLIDVKGNIDPDAFRQYFGPLTIQLHSLSAPFFLTKSKILQRVIRVIFERPCNLDALNKAFENHRGVVYAEKIPKVYKHSGYIPNDLNANELYDQWYLHKIKAPDAWNIGKGSQEVKIAIVDDAIDIEHVDLKDVIWTNPEEIPGNEIDDDDNGYIDDIHGFDVANGDSNPNPISAQQSHGTQVAGLACAATDNNTGIASVGFGVSMISVKTSIGEDGSIQNALQGVIYAIEAGADIINCSWGGYGYGITYEEVMNYAFERGCIVVAAAGNDGVETKLYPAAFSEVIAVGSTSNIDQMSNFSNYGSWISVCAPGQTILSTYPNDQYAVSSGTSMASPIVAGLLGLMKSHYPQLSNEKLKKCLFESADSLRNQNERYIGKTGAGRVNAYRAMQCVDSLKNGITGIGKTNSEDFEDTLRLYPNPASDILYVYLDADYTGPVSLSLLDVQGRQRYHQKCRKIVLYKPAPLALKVDYLPAGLYFVTVTYNNNKRTGKFWVKR